MIEREWKCRCPRKTREGFLAHLRATGVDEASGLPGFLGARVLERDLPGDGRVEIVLVTVWRSEADIRAFAGEDLDTARLYPGDEAFGIDPDGFVTHRRLVDASGGPDRPTPDGR